MSHGQSKVFLAVCAGMIALLTVSLGLDWRLPLFALYIIVLSAMDVTQLGIPMEVMGVALAVSTIVDFPSTACGISAWQLTMLDVADSLGMLDKETLHRIS